MDIRSAIVAGTTGQDEEYAASSASSLPYQVTLELESLDLVTALVESGKATMTSMSWKKPEPPKKKDIPTALSGDRQRLGDELRRRLALEDGEVTPSASVERPTDRANKSLRDGLEKSTSKKRARSPSSGDDPGHRDKRSKTDEACRRCGGNHVIYPHCIFVSPCSICKHDHSTLSCPEICEYHKSSFTNTNRYHTSSECLRLLHCRICGGTHSVVDCQFVCERSSCRSRSLHHMKDCDRDSHR